MKRLLLITVLVLPACRTANNLFYDAPPKQSDHAPLGGRGTRSFEQRQADCWDMPNAQACYEVGMDYELGLRDAKRDKKKALEYYDKACSLEKDPEHCEAAERLR
jgi:TPR repeat protein